MSSQQSTTNWVGRSKEAGLNDRIRNIQKFRDVTTNADEVLRAAKVVLLFLLAITAGMAAFSYVRQFSAFPFWMAVAIAAVLAVAIEFGKNYCSTWAIRTPFFLGWRHIGAEPENTLRWAALLLVAVVTFAASVYNSTQGAKVLSERLDYESKYSEFAPNTADIDAQIQQAQERIAKNNKNTWKGTVIWASQKSNTVEARVIEKLQTLKSERVAQQRADWEAKNAADGSQRQYTGKMVLAAGGWIEVLQILLILLRVACEKSLSGKMEGKQEQSIGFRQQNQPSGFRPATGATPPDQRRTIGFHRQQDYTPPQPAQDTITQIAVPQQPQPVAQPNGLLRGKQADEAVLFHLQRLQKEPSNFQNPQANVETVAGRVHTILSDLERTLNTLGECSLEVAERTSSYILDRIQPLLLNYDVQHDITNIVTAFRRLVGGQQYEGDE